MKKTKNVIQDKTFSFSLATIKLYQILKRKKEFDISRQLLRAGTSIGANVEEAIAAYSKKEFTHKMSLALKEARETRYWLRLIHEGNLTEVSDQYFSEIDEINFILTSIVKTTFESLNSKSMNT